MASADVAAPGDEAWFVALPGGDLLVEEGAPGLDPASLAAAIAVDPPWRAHAVRRADAVWSVAARRLEVVQLLDDPGGTEVVVAWDGLERTVQVDGEPTLAGAPELERLGSARHAAYVVTAHRLGDRLWEVVVAAL